MKRFLTKLICCFIPVATWRHNVCQHWLDGQCSIKLFHLSAQAHGNAGDWILAESLRDTIAMVFNRKIHWIKRNVRKSVTPHIIRKINKCDALVIGGGGLFLKDTNANNISGWQWPCPIELLRQIKVPIFVIAVGYNRFRNQDDFDSIFFENVSELINKSKYFGLRNHGSVRAICDCVPKKLHDKISYFPCTTTILSRVYNVSKQNNVRPIIGLNIAFDRSDKRFGADIGLVLDKIVHAMKKLSTIADIRYYAHCESDALFTTFLQSAGIKFEIVRLNQLHLDMHEYIKLYSEPDLVIGMRGHAQMIPFGCNTPIISLISHDKMKWFLDDIDHPEFGIEIHDPKLDIQLYEKAVDILKHRQEIIKKLVTAQDKLFNITNTELRKILQIIEGKSDD